MEIARLITVCAITALLTVNPIFAAEDDSDPDACPCIANGSWTLAAASVKCSAQVIYNTNFSQSGQYSRRLTIAESEGSHCATALLYVSQDGGGYCSAYLGGTLVEGVCEAGVSAQANNLNPIDINNCEYALEILRSDVNSLEDCL